jgi:hypothetical protein
MGSRPVPDREPPLINNQTNPIRESTRANAGSFKKGEKRPNQGKRGPNKENKALKEMILAALEDCGGVDYLVTQAHDNPTAFMGLIGKVLPLTLAGDPNKPIHFAIGLPWLNQQIQTRNSA